MNQARGIDIIGLKAVIREKNAHDLELQLRENISPEACTVYRECVEKKWYPMSAYLEIMTAAADYFYKTQPDRLRKIARDVAYKNINGVYRVFLRIPTLEFVMQYTNLIWYSYNDSGTCVFENYRKEENKAFGTMIVKDYPTLPESALELISGHILAIMEMTGARNVDVTRKDDDPNNWKWLVSVAY